MERYFSRHALTQFALGLLGPLIALLFFLAPTNFFLSFQKETAYVTGVFSDYLVFKLYITDITAIVFSALYGWLSFKSKSLKKYLKKIAFFVPPISIFAIIQLFSGRPPVGLWNLAGWLVIGSTCFLILNFARKNSRIFLVYATAGITLALVFQSIIGISQYLNQRSVAGYWLLGEPSLSQPFGIAKTITLSGENMILPYGTTAHPNILAGMLLLYVSILWLTSTKKTSNLKKLTILGCSAIAVPAAVLTQSFSAFLIVFTTISLGVISCKLPTIKRDSIIHLLTKHLVSVVVITTLLVGVMIHLSANTFPDTPSVTRRNWLQETAFAMILNNPVWGIGFGQFTQHAQLYAKSTDIWSFLQPVHSVPLLIFSELGIVGICILLYLWKNASQRTQQAMIATVFLALGPLSLDHYLWSLQPGRWILIVMFVMIFSWFGSSPPKQLSSRGNR